MKTYQSHDRAVWESIFRDASDEWLRVPPSAMMQSCADFLAAHGSRCVVDVGSGFARWSSFLSRELAADVVGIEYTLGGNVMARKVIAGTAARVVTADACRLPLATRAFDAAVAILLLENLARIDAVEAAREIARVCRPSSPVFIVLNPLETQHPIVTAKKNPTEACHIERYTDGDLREIFSGWTFGDPEHAEHGFRVYKAATPASRASARDPCPPA